MAPTTKNPTKKSKTTDSETSDTIEKLEKKTAKAKTTTVAKSQSTNTKKPTSAKSSSTTAKTKTAKKSTGTTTTSSRAKSKKSIAKDTAVLSDIEKAALIEKTAYYIAEARGFEQGDPMQDWLLAESRVNQMIQEGRL